MKSNLLVRLISAIIALIVIIPIIYFEGYVFKAGMLLLSTICYKELLDLKKSHQKIPLIMEIVGLLTLLFIIISRTKFYEGIPHLELATLFICLLIPIIFYKDKKYNSKEAFYLIGIIIFLATVFNIFILVRSKGLNLFILLLLIPSFNDIFAYFVGSLLGKHKMCPTISPHKTWEGSFGGLLFGVVGSLVYYKFFVDIIDIKVVSMVIILSIVGQMGDLVFSKIKRENEIKDYSNLMPGHGGLLDRIDSVVFVFLAYMILMNI